MPRDSLRNLPTGLLRFGEPVGGDAAGDVEGSVGGDGDAELEQLVDAPLVLWCRGGEVPSGVSGEVPECFELCPLGVAALFPEVELGEVVAEPVQVSPERWYGGNAWRRPGRKSSETARAWSGLRFFESGNSPSGADTFMVMAISDRELWAAAVHQGDADAFGVLFERHARAVYNHLFRRCADWSSAEDLTSVVFLEAWRKRHRVELDRESALPWLLGVATNVVLNHRRSVRRYRAALSRVPLPEIGAPASVGVQDFAGDAAGRVAAESEMRLILVLVERLPERERQVLELCAWDGLSYEDAAAVLGVPVGTVRSRLSRARDRLRELERRSGHERGVHSNIQIVPEVEQ